MNLKLLDVVAAKRANMIQSCHSLHGMHLTWKFMSGMNFHVRLGRPGLYWDGKCSCDITILVWKSYELAIMGKSWFLFFIKAWKKVKSCEFNCCLELTSKFVTLDDLISKLVFATFVFEYGTLCGTCYAVQCSNRAHSNYTRLAIKVVGT